MGKRKLKKARDFEADQNKTSKPIFAMEKAVDECISLESVCHKIILSPPPFVRISYSSAEHRKIGVTLLKDTIRQNMERFDLGLPNKCLFVLKSQNCKLKGPYGKHKYFQAMRGALKNVQRIQKFNLRRICTDFSDSIVLNDDDTLLAPSAERLEHLLACILSTARILADILHLCKEAASQSAQQLQIQHFIPPNLMLLANVAELRSCCQKMLSHLSNIYPSLQQFLPKLKRNLGKTVPGLKFGNCLADFSEKIERSLDEVGQKPTKEQREVYIKFLEDLLECRNLQVDLEHEAKVSRIQNFGKTGPSLKEDLGVPVFEKKSSELEIIIYHLNNSSKLNALKSVFRLIKGYIKEFEAKLEQAQQTRDRENSKTVAKNLKILKKCKILFKSQWSSLTALKKQSNFGRLNCDIDEMKCQISRILKS